MNDEAKEEEFTCRLANYANSFDVNECAHLLNEYSKSEFGASKDVSEFCRRNITKEMRKMCANDVCFSVLAIQNRSGACVGLINCFMAFSTFQCRPIVNVHDVFVVPNCRGMNITGKMMRVVEDEASRRRACKITLEVLSENTSAKRSYQKFGFEPYQLDPKQGFAMFYEKKLSVNANSSSNGEDVNEEEEEREVTMKKCSACSTPAEKLTKSTMMEGWNICNNCVTKEQSASAYDVRYSR
jgi:ribosomal protein S18 acetylase RimI-like enzyme